MAKEELRRHVGLLRAGQDVASLEKLALELAAERDEARELAVSYYKLIARDMAKGAAIDDTPAFNRYPWLAEAMGCVWHEGDWVPKAWLERRSKG